MLVQPFAFLLLYKKICVWKEVLISYQEKTYMWREQVIILPPNLECVLQSLPYNYEMFMSELYMTFLMKPALRAEFFLSALCTIAEDSCSHSSARSFFHYSPSEYCYGWVFHFSFLDFYQCFSLFKCILMEAKRVSQHWIKNGYFALAFFRLLK